MSHSLTQISFPALQGNSLFGYLAALGTFRTLASLSKTRELRMRWVPGGASYWPELQFSSYVSRDDIAEQLHVTLGGLAGHYVINADKDLKIPCKAFRHLAERAVSDFLTHADPWAASMVAAFGCDAVGNEDGLIEDTAFRTMSGAGHQHFLEFMVALAKETTLEQIKEALFGPWRYRDPSPTMRWDAEDDRRYALRWDEPSKDPVRTVRGANLLAIAALPFFPVIPTATDSVATTCFIGRGSRDTFFTWPIWTGFMGLDPILALLGSKEVLSQDENSAWRLGQYGVVARYRSQRITLGKYRNFSPAAPM